MKDLLTGFKNKKGSFAIFAVMAFSAMLIILGASIKASAGLAIGSAAESFGHLWGRSILAEYDVFLKESYGIFGFYGNEASVAQKLDYYVKYSCEDKPYLDYGQASVSLEGKSLAETDNLKAQLEDAVLQGFEPPKKEASGASPEDGQMARTSRYIDSQWIIKSLPSYGRTESSYIMGLVNKVKGGMSLESMGESLVVDQYIFTFFKDYMNQRDLKDRYFTCEVEYIISGSLSDDGAKRETARKIKAFRNMLNLAYLYSCNEKREAAMVLAQTLTPGPAAVLTQAVILEAWAYAEAENDMKILYDNKTVPLLKDDSNWALSLENVFDSEGEVESSSGGYVSPQVLRGDNYPGYLAILLCGISEETKLLRIMDLIQINMKYLYCDYFLLKDYNVGLKYQLKIKGVGHEFEESY